MSRFFSSLHFSHGRKNISTHLPFNVNNLSSFQHIVNGQESKFSKLWSIAIGASKKNVKNIFKNVKNPRLNGCQ
jgi:hypothetical protein